jgi:long-chain acyl-CoA synthetase
MKTVEGEAPVDPFPVTSSDLCTIIYTSGTTGKPKGVELTHSNLVSNMKGINKMWAGQHSQHTSLAFLPWAHVYGQTCEVFLGFARGDSMAIVGSREQIVEGIAMVKPTTLLAVPALFNRVYDGIMKKASSGSATQQKVFKAALQAARRRNHLLEFGKPVPIFLRLQYAFFDRIVFSKIRERLGGRLVCMCAGGAATTMPVLEFFEDIGIPVCSGYGLTETSPVIAASTPAWSTRRLGTNGPLLEGVCALFIDPVTLEEVPFGQEGELIVSGPNVMAGYHNKPEATAEVFLMKHGKKYFRTGDLGLLEDGKFLKITGRIKEQFKLENGKYVVPIPVEEAICRSAFVAQVARPE